eukprot:15326458-Alexandrium_andersonii.AAC.1
MRAIPLSAQQRHRLVISKVLPIVFYGIQSAPVPGKLHRTLRSAIKTTLTPGITSFGNPTLACMSWGRKNPDPNWHVLHLRIKTLRVMWSSSAHCRD